jgi:NTP pyrophosphatase (non-canonical NTP hydrolase)
MAALELLERCSTLLASLESLVPGGLEDGGPLQSLQAEIAEELEYGMPPQDWKLLLLANKSMCERIRLQERICEWQNATFGEANTLQGLLAKLQEEVDELRDAPLELKPKEACDCLHVLMGIAGKLDIDLLAATEVVFQQNQIRKWGPPGQDGRIRHLEEA